MRKFWNRFAADRRGAVAIMVAGGIVAFVAFVGLATDAARGYMVKAKLSEALDAAGLAGGHAMNAPTRDEDIAMFFNANFPAGFMGATIDGPHFTIDPTNTVVNVNASATIDTTFMRVLGFQHMTVSSATQVTRETQLLEVVIALDLSGSMGDYLNGKPKIKWARDSATDLVNILFGGQATADLLKIGLVPWNSKVKVMRDNTTYNSALTTTQAVPSFKNPLTGLNQSTLWYANNSPVPLLKAPNSSWKGCVYQQYIKNSIDDDADIYLDGLTTPTGSWMGWEPVGTEGEPTSSNFTNCTGAVGGQECVACLTYGITPLTNTKATIQAGINRLLTPAGGTNIPEGLQWAWEVLMPSAPFTEATPEDPPIKRQRAIVLMTDGENCGASGDGYKATWGLCPNSGHGPAQMDDRLTALAANIKAAGVQIYAIQFGNANTAQQTLMKQIASSDKAPYYWYAPTAADLSTAFNTIANTLSQLRVSM
jgi:Flp pilus assembly protein TadG